MAYGSVAVTDEAAYEGRQTRTRGGALRRLEKLMASENVAKDLDPVILERLGDKCLREFEIDKNSRAEWEDTTKEALKLAKQTLEKKNYPWANAANIKYPLLTTAAIQFAARAYPAIINGPDVVKGRVRGKDDGIPAPQMPQQGMPQGLPQGQPAGPQMSPQSAPPALSGPPAAPPSSGVPGPGAAPVSHETQWQVKPGAKKERAERIAKHMSYQLLDEMEEWEADTDKLLHVVPIVGCAFRKVYFDPSLGRNCSELVHADDFVINYWAKSIDTAPRYTHCIRLYPHEIEERIRDERFVDFDYGPAQAGEGGEGQSAQDEDAPHDFLEQHRLEDLDDDGYPEPYIVTVHKDTAKVCRIVACFDESGIKLGSGDQIQRIQRKQYFVKYPFIPALDGGFYDIGFGVLLRPLSEAINTSINQMLDAGHLQNTGGGFIGAGLRIKGGNARFSPGEFKRVISQGGSIKDNIVPMPWPGPSTTLFNLLGLLIEAARDITSVKDVMTGDSGPKNEAATRTLARIEQGMKVFSAIYKRVFRSLKKEFKILFDLNAQYLEEEAYFTFEDDPKAVARKDYNQADLDVLPVADPNMVTEVQRMAQAEFLHQFLADPYVKPYEARQRIFGAVGITSPDELLTEQPPQDPNIAQAADEIDIKKREAEIKAEKNKIDQNKMLADVAVAKSTVILNLAKAEQAADKTQIEALSVLLDSILQAHGHAIERGKALDTREANAEKLKLDQRRVSGVAGSSNNRSGASVSG